MKKFFVMLVGICWLTMFNFAIVEAQEIAENDLVVESGEISAEMDSYAKNNVSKKLVSMIIPEGKGYAELNDYTLGSGISMLNTYEKVEERTAVYPIYYDGQIVYTYMLKKDDGQYVDTLGVSLVKELNELAVKEKDSEVPVKLFNKGYDIYYTDGNEKTELLYQAPIQSDVQKETTVEEVVDVISSERTEVVDVSEEKEYVNRPLTLAENRNELNKGNPIFVFSKVEYDANAKYDYHALVLHGWVSPEKGLNVYYIWNPWYPHTNCIDGGVKSPTLPFPGGKFKWETSIRNFQ
ncbi:hypothetical protein ACWOC1_14475 [Enterococcus quebecensis]|nr:hypothetical protein [Enterococcus quebecensis]